MTYVGYGYNSGWGNLNYHENCVGFICLCIKVFSYHNDFEGLKEFLWDFVCKMMFDLWCLFNINGLWYLLQKLLDFPLDFPILNRDIWFDIRVFGVFTLVSVLKVFVWLDDVKQWTFILGVGCGVIRLSRIKVVFCGARWQLIWLLIHLIGSELISWILLWISTI